MTGQIIAMGGGGFSMEPDNPAMDRYILAQSGKTKPKVLFLSPCSSTLYGYKFFDAFTKLDCSPVHLSLFEPSTRAIESLILEQNVIYVGGGNTKSMLALWREWGLD